MLTFVLLSILFRLCLCLTLFLYLYLSLSPTLSPYLSPSHSLSLSLFISISHFISLSISISLFIPIIIYLHLPLYLLIYLYLPPCWDPHPDSCADRYPRDDLNKFYNFLSFTFLLPFILFYFVKWNVSLSWTYHHSRRVCCSRTHPGSGMVISADLCKKYKNITEIVPTYKT